jgi:Terpene cyclase DEP1
MTWRERPLLALTIVGFLVPNTMVTIFFIDHGVDLGGYFSHWGESLPAAQLAADVSIAFLAFALWSAWEGRRIGMRTWWLPIPASALVGCASPFRSSCSYASGLSASDRQVQDRSRQSSRSSSRRPAAGRQARGGPLQQNPVPIRKCKRARLSHPRERRIIRAISTTPCRFVNCSGRSRSASS